MQMDNVLVKNDLSKYDGIPTCVDVKTNSLFFESDDKKSMIRVKLIKNSTDQVTVSRYKKQDLKNLFGELDSPIHKNEGFLGEEFWNINGSIFRSTPDKPFPSSRIGCGEIIRQQTVISQFSDSNFEILNLSVVLPKENIEIFEGDDCSIAIKRTPYNVEDKSIFSACIIRKHALASKIYSSVRRLSDFSDLSRSFLTEDKIQQVEDSIQIKEKEWFRSGGYRTRDMEHFYEQAIGFCAFLGSKKLLNSSRVQRDFLEQTLVDVERICQSPLNDFDQTCRPFGAASLINSLIRNISIKVDAYTPVFPKDDGDAAWAFAKTMKFLDKLPETMSKDIIKNTSKRMKDIDAKGKVRHQIFSKEHPVHSIVMSCYSQAALKYGLQNHSVLDKIKPEEEVRNSIISQLQDKDLNSSDLESLLSKIESMPDQTKENLIYIACRRHYAISEWTGAFKKLYKLSLPFLTNDFPERETQRSICGIIYMVKILFLQHRDLVENYENLSQFKKSILKKMLPDFDESSISYLLSIPVFN